MHLATCNKDSILNLVPHQVLLLEKGSWGRYSVVKGTPDKMLDHLLESEIEEEGTEGEWGGGGG